MINLFSVWVLVWILMLAWRHIGIITPGRSWTINSGVRDEKITLAIPSHFSDLSHCIFPSRVFSFGVIQQGKKRKWMMNEWKREVCFIEKSSTMSKIVYNGCLIVERMIYWFISLVRVWVSERWMSDGRDFQERSIVLLIRNGEFKYCQCDFFHMISCGCFFEDALGDSENADCLLEYLRT